MKNNKINHILVWEVEIQAMEGTKFIPEYSKCQAFDHTQNYYCKEPTYVRCGGNHLTGNCQQKLDNKTKNGFTVVLATQQTKGDI